MRVDRITLMVKKQQHMCRTFQSHLPQCRGDKYLFCTTPGYCGILEMPAEDHPQQLDVSLTLWSFLKEKKVSLAFIQVKIHCCDCLKNTAPLSVPFLDLSTVFAHESWSLWWQSQSLYSAWYGRPVVSLKYREDMNYITVDGCSSQEKEAGEKSRKRQTQRDFNWHVRAGHLAKHLGTLKVKCVISVAETEFQK